MPNDDDILQSAPERRTRHERFVKVLIPIICLGMLIVLPEIMTTADKPFQSVPMLKLGIYLKALIFVAVFYVNYYFIIGKNLDRSKFVWRLIGYNLIVLAVSMVLFWLISNWMEPYWNEARQIRQTIHGFDEPPHPRGPMHGPDLGHLLGQGIRDFVMIVLTIGLCLSIRLIDNWMKLARRSEQLIATRRQQELQNLKSQLNPHFLFNTLNSIYALIAISPAQAQEAVHELSGLLRYMLYGNDNMVEVSKELKFIDNFVKLMSLRLAPSTTLEVNVSACGRETCKVAPLLFVPLVENVFKHCNIGSPGAKISIYGVIIDDKIIFRTVNTCQTEADKLSLPLANAEAESIPEQKEKSGGIGLQNLRRRLLLIYGDKASLTTNLTNNIFTTELIIPVEDE
jgi:hypothetical protein